MCDLCAVCDPLLLAIVMHCNTICSLVVVNLCGLLQARQKDLVMPTHKIERTEEYTGGAIIEPQRG